MDTTKNSAKALKCERCLKDVNLDKNKKVVFRCENCVIIDRELITFLTEEFKKLDLKKEKRFENIMLKMEVYERESQVYNIDPKCSNSDIYENLYRHVNTKEIPIYSCSATNERYDHFISFQDVVTFGVVKVNYFLKKGTLKGKILCFNKGRSHFGRIED